MDSLKTQLGSLITEEFNGVSLFGGTNATGGALGTNGSLTVVTSEDGGQSVAISQLNLAYLSDTAGIGTTVTTNTSQGIHISTNALATDAV